MVLGLIDFLLGGKKKNKVPKTGNVAAPVSSRPTVSSGSEPNQIPDGVNKPTDNASEMQFEDSNSQDESSSNEGVKSQNKNEVEKIKSDVSPAKNNAYNPAEPVHQKKPISDIITKINSELKDSSERLTGLVTDFKEMENTVNTIGHRLDELEESKKATDEKIHVIDESMTKFLSLYELINNQYNPFVDKDDIMPVLQKKPFMVSADGNTMDSENESEDVENADDSEKSPISMDELKVLAPELESLDVNSNDLGSVFLELDTLDLDSAAADSVPLKTLKNNTNSLVIILSWLEYLIKRVGKEETRNSLRYYTEVLRWTTPEVYFELDKYLKGMKDKKITEGADTLDVKDHIVSLYFISKLNDKPLDEKLTRAVLQIIKQ